MIESHKQQEWLGWFGHFDSDESIRLAAYQPCVPIPRLAYLSIEEACQKLDHAWRAIFVPGPQQLQFLRSLLDQAYGFARSCYPTVTDYNRLRYSSIQTIVTPQPIRCLTGLAGVSKSSLVEAFERICLLQPNAEFLTEGQRLTLYPVRRVKINGQPAVQGILQGMSNPIALTGRVMKGMAGLMTHVSDWFIATATSALVVDEMQFFTQSSAASTKTSHLIMTLANLGPPLVYVANFSLVRKLMLRPQEERDRLLSAPMVLEPPASDDQWWRDVLGEYFAVSPGVFRLDAVSHAAILHCYTAGLFRALRQLLLQAYREARLRGKDVVTLDEVKLAYGSRAYSSHRKDVEDLVSLAISSQMAEKRPDLVCPFSEVRVPDKLAKSTTRQQPLPLQPLRSPSEALLESSISARARSTLHDLREAANRPSEERTTAVVTRLPKRTPVTAQTLRLGAQVLHDVLKPSTAGVKPSRVQQGSSDDTAS